MLFNSIGYLLFLPVTVILFYILPVRWRSSLLLAVSYIFYLTWQPGFVLVLITATLVSYFTALKMGEKPKKKERLKYLILLLSINLGMLILFKYLGFFTEIIRQISAISGSQFVIHPFSIVLPIGISFYTFQTVGYGMDVYRGLIKPERNIGTYALFVSFFPLVLAGPIERGRRLIGQLHHKVDFDPGMISGGLRLIFWGMFKKIVIADRLSIFVQPVFNEPGYFHGVEIGLALIVKMMQVYADFSGYTDIAIGSARLLGIRLSPNFNRPFSAQSIAAFWSRWHISLTSWMRDYVYFSLPFTWKGKTVTWRANVNLVITFLLVGFWHGAYWNFIIFGLLHGTFMVLANLSSPAVSTLTSFFKLDKTPGLLKWINIVITFLLVCSSGVFFGQQPLQDSFLMIKNLLDFSQTGTSILQILKNNDILLGILLILFMLWFEYLVAVRSFAVTFRKQPVVIRFAAYFFLLFFILIFGVYSNQKFFYFQF